MSLLMAPMYVLFEGSILFARLLERRTRRAEAAEEAEAGEAEDPPSRERELVTLDQD